MELDVIILLLIAGGVLLGYIRGAIRQLMALGAWLVSFVAAALIHQTFGPYLATQGPAFSRVYIDMLGFLLLFGLPLIIAMVVIQFYGNVSSISQHALLDEVTGGVLCAGFVLLTVSSLIVILDTYYLVSNPPPTAEIGLLREAHVALERSTIAGWLRDSLIPGLGAVLGPLVPAHVRAVMG